MLQHDVDDLGRLERYIRMPEGQIHHAHSRLTVHLLDSAARFAPF
jgi:hypothetical protein